MKKEKQNNNAKIQYLRRRMREKTGQMGREQCKRVVI